MELTFAKEGLEYRRDRMWVQIAWFTFGKIIVSAGVELRAQLGHMRRPSANTVGQVVRQDPDT